jgi:hypothetical protein
MCKWIPFLKCFLQMQNDMLICLVTPRRQCAMQGMNQGMGERNRIQKTIE